MYTVDSSSRVPYHGGEATLRKVNPASSEAGMSQAEYTREMDGQHRDSISNPEPV